MFKHIPGIWNKVDEFLISLPANEPIGTPFKN
jgi:hypothetical protein